MVNRVFDSAGPEGRVRGTPQQIIDKYLTLARDAGLTDDRVGAENFQQHAEHYRRILNEAQRQIAKRQEENQARNEDKPVQKNQNGYESPENSDDDNIVDTPENQDSPKRKTRAPKQAKAEVASEPEQTADNIQ